MNGKVGASWQGFNRGFSSIADWISQSKLNQVLSFSDGIMVAYYLNPPNILSCVADRISFHGMNQVVSGCIGIS